MEPGFLPDPQRLINPQHIFNLVRGHALPQLKDVCLFFTIHLAMCRLTPLKFTPSSSTRLQALQAIRESEQECDS